MKRLLLALLVAAPLHAQSLDQLIDREMNALLNTYRQLHASPELPMQEQNTSALLATQLRGLGYTVSERVGKYDEPNATCYGVVAVMKNGNGPTVLVRSDMDALPVEEQTGLAYASQHKGVMHACGHDIHITTLIGTAKMLAQLKNQWHGTVMLVGQPAEEVSQGASAMLRGGLYEQFGNPDFAIAIHDNDRLPAGQIGYTPGFFMAAVDSLDVTMRGLGGHGAKPQATKDPIVMAAEFITALQTIASTEEPPPHR